VGGMCGCQEGTDRIALGMSIGQLALLLKKTNDLVGSADQYRRCLEIFEETDGPNRCVRALKKAGQAHAPRPTLTDLARVVWCVCVSVCVCVCARQPSGGVGSQQLGRGAARVGSRRGGTTFLGACAGGDLVASAPPKPLHRSRAHQPRRASS
jgi:hypothetical protein